MWLWECQKCLASVESEDEPGNPCGCESEYGELQVYYVESIESE